MFTLIGGGMKRLEQSFRYMANVLPKKIQWFKERAIHFDPNNNTVSTSGGHDIKYDMLLIASGLELKYEKVKKKNNSKLLITFILMFAFINSNILLQIPGLVEGLSIPNGKVCSIYSPKYVDRTYDALRNIEKGNAIFTFPSSPVKCPGAPQKIVYIAEHYLRKVCSFSEKLLKIKKLLLKLFKISDKQT